VLPAGILRRAQSGTGLNRDERLADLLNRVSDVLADLRGQFLINACVIWKAIDFNLDRAFIQGRHVRADHFAEFEPA
jgi:hypothetical protein